jgi:hypothetical protein
MSAHYVSEYLLKLSPELLYFSCHQAGNFTDFDLLYFHVPLTAGDALCVPFHHHSCGLFCQSHLPFALLAKIRSQPHCFFKEKIPVGLLALGLWPFHTRSCGVIASCVKILDSLQNNLRARMSQNYRVCEGDCIPFDVPSDPALLASGEASPFLPSRK